MILDLAPHLPGLPRAVAEHERAVWQRHEPAAGARRQVGAQHGPPLQGRRPHLLHDLRRHRRRQLPQRPQAPLQLLPNNRLRRTHTYEVLQQTSVNTPVLVTAPVPAGVNLLAVATADGGHVSAAQELPVQCDARQGLASDRDRKRTDMAASMSSTAAATASGSWRAAPPCASAASRTAASSRCM